MTADALYRRARPASASGRWSSAISTASPILASETCALDIMGARFVRDVEPGEVVVARPRAASRA